jgi:hypothetical protein
LELFEDGPLTSFPHYGETIKRIDKRLRLLFPKAKIVFATSTCIKEIPPKYYFTRHNSIIEQYNAEAIRSLEGTGAVINDLYSLSVSLPESYRSDAVHFHTPEATEIIGGRVLSVICDLLGIEAAEVNIKDFNPEQYSASSIGY